MSLHSLRRMTFRRLHWLRVWLATLLLCFTLGTIAHAGHHHVASTQDTHAQCDYCHGLGGLMDAPASSADVPAAATTETHSALAHSVYSATRLTGLPPARAPPAR